MKLKIQLNLCFVFLPASAPSSCPDFHKLTISKCVLTFKMKIDKIIKISLLALIVFINIMEDL